MLDSAISSAGIASEKDMKYFATLNDNWLYGNNLGRPTGKRWSYYYTPGVELFGERTKDLRRLNFGDTIINNIYMTSVMKILIHLLQIFQ
jgi:hypothetical protein